MKAVKWFVACLLIFITGSLIVKSFQLKQIVGHVDGDGIGVQLFGIELADRLPASQISFFANSLLVGGGLFLVASFYLIYTNLKKTS